MIIKLTSKIQHLLLIVVMLLNPIITSADVLFADKNSSTVSLSMSSDADKQANCHDEKSKTAENSDCCEDLCQCSASNCHSPSATASYSKSLFEPSIYLFNYLRIDYLSFVSSPSSPPPITA